MASSSAVATHTVAVVGGTGLVGSKLLPLLVAAPFISKVTSLSRRPIAINNEKVFSHAVNFSDTAAWKPLLAGSHAFVTCLGTTKADAGSFEKQYAIDYTLNLELAKAAKESGAKTCVVVSSQSASPSSMIGYSRMKGELDRDVLALDFDHTIILQPGLLLGPRERSRTGEGFAQSMARGLKSLGLGLTSTAIEAEDVGKCIVKVIQNPGPEKVRIIQNAEMIAIAHSS